MSDDSENNFNNLGININESLISVLLLIFVVLRVITIVKNSKYQNKRLIYQDIKSQSLNSSQNNEA